MKKGSGHLTEQFLQVFMLISEEHMEVFNHHSHARGRFSSF